MNVYITTSIPYVNAPPHLGHALEFVQADLIARFQRQRGIAVRLQTGTDDNALKNVQAARAASLPTADFVTANADRFAALVDRLQVEADDFVRTGTDARHRAGVLRLWRSSAARGDFYRKRYSGLYCTGCEQFYDPLELADGECAEHPDAVEPTSETNWFFRLSRYTERIENALTSGQVRIEPPERANEVLSFVRSGLADISVSRPISRSGGWGIPVPDDPEQVVYVWWDALANYVTTLGDVETPHYDRWWAGSRRRIHVIGKGILRFHAVYWLGLLLSTGQPLPTEIFVHEYLSTDGAKISKSTGGGPDPGRLLDRYGVDALRWWLASDVARLGDTDFTEERLERRYTQDLVGGVGNLVHRVCALCYRHQVGRPRAECRGETGRSSVVLGDLEGRIATHLDHFDPRGAAGEIRGAVALANRYLEDRRPWELARAAGQARVHDVVATALLCCGEIVRSLHPFVPAGAARLHTELGAAGTREPRRAFAPLPRTRFAGEAADDRQI